jgi:peroxiredoxin
MVALQTPRVELGWQAADFSLPGIDGKTHGLRELAGEKGTVVAFICNHCPYVKAITGRLVAAADEMREFGVELIAINPNDAEAYKEDSFENMKRFAAERGFNFPYLHDVSQEVARAYEAVCTPDFFGFDKDLKLKYRGRLDIGRKEPPPEGAPNDLVNAMGRIADHGDGPAEQFPSMGCSIKWKA